MYLCVCNAVSERTARRAIRDDEIVTLRELSRRLGVGTCCGKCVPAARALLEQERAPGAAAMPAASVDLMTGSVAA